MKIRKRLKISTQSIVKHWLLSSIGLFALLAASNVSAQSNSDPVVRGREAFQSQGEWDWYDSSSDSLKPMDPPVAPQSNNSSANGTGGGGNGGSFGGGGGSSSGGGSIPMSAGGGFEALGTVFSVIAWIVIIALLIALVVGIIWAIMKLDLSKDDADFDELDDKPEEVELKAIDKLPFDIDKSIGNFLDAARLAYQQQDFRKATIYTFSHMLLILDQNQLIRLTRGKTNRQYLAEIRQIPELTSFFEEVMVSFEAAFFGDRDIAKEQFESFWNQVDRFHNNVRQRMPSTQNTPPHLRPMPA